MQIRRGVSINDDMLRALCQKYGVAELSLFGSSAKGTAHAQSDVDLLVLFEPDARVTFFTLARLRRELSEALGLAVDLVPKDGSKPLIQDEVLASARVLYAA